MRLAFWAIASLAAAQQIQFDPVSQDIVDQRVHAFTKKNATRAAALHRLFEDAGCAGDALADQPVKGMHEPNVVCTQRGETDAVIVVGAHFDLVEAGQGVVDNWSGASLLPSLFQGLSKIPRKHGFVFVGFTGEEKGLVGSKAYVKQMGDSLAHVQAMVNMDTLGLSDTKIWASHADPSLVDWAAATASTLKLPVGVVNVDQVGSSDSESFRERRIPAITIHSLTQDTLRILHSPKDRIEALHIDEYYRTYRFVLGYLAVLDEKLKTPVP